MFDACDPMLEARLAESVEAMMHCLHQPATTAAEAESAAKGPADPKQMRVETVNPDELRQLPRLVSSTCEELDLESGVSGEYLSVLVDTCTTGDEPTQAAARALLRQDFAVEANADLQVATDALFHCLQEIMGDAESDQGTHNRLSELCSAIAASVIIETHAEREKS